MSSTLFLLIVSVVFSNVICAPIIVNDDLENVPFEDSRDDWNEDSNENISKTKVPGRVTFKRQFFQDVFSDHLAPLLFQFGHVCENPSEWEQRFEQRDFENNRHQGKVLWGNANGNYGEHYWDLASGK